MKEKERDSDTKFGHKILTQDRFDEYRGTDQSTGKSCKKYESISEKTRDENKLQKKNISLIILLLF